MTPQSMIQRPLYILDNWPQINGKLLRKYRKFDKHCFARQTLNNCLKYFSSFLIIACYYELYSKIEQDFA